MQVPKNLFILILLITSLNAEEIKVNQQSFINEDSINLREKPDVSSKILTSLNRFSKVKILNIDPKIVQIKKWKGRWIKVQAERSIGFVLDIFLMKNHKSIEELISRDSYWEVDSYVYEIGKMGAVGDNDTQGELRFSKEPTEMVRWGNGEGQKSCIFKEIYSGGNSILIQCDTFFEEPDHNEEGNKKNMLILLEKINRSKIKIVNFGFEG